MRGIVVSFVALGMLVVSAGVASAQVIAQWEMNEARGARTMADSSGKGLNGTIGNRVTTGITVGTGRGYNFPGPASGYDPGRLVQIPDNAALDPGTSPYAVTLRFRTPNSEPNIVQKGQSGQTGGFFKLVLKKGYPRCHFRDENGRTKAIGFVDMGRQYKVDDNLWHTVRCERTATGTRVTLNYGESNAVSKFIRGTIGRIDNRRPFLIGGKLDCASADVGCDYFRGQIDYVRVEKG
jgi:hypothetical protein